MIEEILIRRNTIYINAAALPNYNLEYQKTETDDETSKVSESVQILYLNSKFGCPTIFWFRVC